MKEEQVTISEELRTLMEEYSQLKKDLNAQKVINHQLMEATFHRNIKTIMNDKKVSLIAGGIAAVLFLLMWYVFSTPFIYTAVLEVLALALIAANIIFYKKFDLDQVDFSDVLSCTKLIQNFRESYLRMEFIIWGICIATIICFIPRILSAWSTPTKALCCILFLAIVVSAGILYDCHYSKNIIRNCDSIIKSLDDFSEQREKC